MMDCEGARALLDAWERGDRIEEGEARAFLEHLAACPSCAAARSGFGPLLAREIRPEAGSIPLPPTPAAIRLADSVMARIDEEGVAPAAPGLGPRLDFPGARRRAPAAKPGIPAAARAGVAVGRLGLLAAAAVLALGIGLGLAFGLRDPNVATMRFVLDAPLARTVALAGDFNGWKPGGYELRKGKDGGWEIEVRLRKDRMYSYNFVIDGERWIVDPSSPDRVDDGFGGSSSLLRL